jgi:hypothetical protein
VDISDIWWCGHSHLYPISKRPSKGELPPPPRGRVGDFGWGLGNFLFLFSKLKEDGEGAMNELLRHTIRIYTKKQHVGAAVSFVLLEKMAWWKVRVLFFLLASQVSLNKASDPIASSFSISRFACIRVLANITNGRMFPSPVL